MKNKGFSLVELIIVIAIIVILGGVLVPMLITYINRSRRSADIDTGKELAMAIATVVTEDSAKDNAKGHETPWPVNDMDGNDFKNAVYEYLSADEIKGKSQKDADGNTFGNPIFYYTLNVTTGKVEIYYGGTGEDCQIYPKTGSKLLK